MSEPDPNAPIPPPAETTGPATAAAPQTAPPYSALGPAPLHHSPLQRGRGVLGVFSALGFLLLLAGLGWLWNGQREMDMRLAEVAQRPIAAPDTGRTAALEAKLKDLEAKLAALQQRPPTTGGAAVDLKPLEGRVSALERSGGTSGSNAPDLGPLTAKIDAAASEAAAAKSAAGGLDGRIAALEARLKTDEAQQAALAERAVKLLSFERAQMALEAGEPLGDLPGAAPALVKFAHNKPPTEAALRLAFPAAADAAEAASRPSGAGKAIAERMWIKVRSLVTIKEGDKVLVGPPAAAVLGNAHAKLEAGDLGGALATLGGLDDAAAKAMADWRSAAQALLDARAALSEAARS